MWFDACIDLIFLQLVVYVADTNKSMPFRNGDPGVVFQVAEYVIYCKLDNFCEEFIIGDAFDPKFNEVREH